MTVYDRKDWGARAPRGGPGPLDPDNVIGLAFHWPAMSGRIRTVDDAKAALRAWQNYHMDGRGWSDIAYQVAVDQMGNRYWLRGLRTQSGANGDTDANERYGAVLLLVGPGEGCSEEMVQEVRRVVRDHRRHFPNSRKLVGHGQIRPEPTACPGPAVQSLISGGLFEPDWTPKPKPKPEPPSPRHRLAVITANLFKNNRHAADDLALLAGTGAHIIGINEGKNFADLIQALDGYTAYYGNQGTGRPEQANPTLVRDDITVHGEGYTEISEAVGKSPGRAAVHVKYDFHGQKRAHVNLHANSHVQDGQATPHRLPRVREYIRGQQATAALIRGLEEEGYAVTITGDLNWSWTRRARQWTWAPKVVFGALGYRAQFEHDTNPARPKGDPRPIEYVLYKPSDLTIESQSFVEGEHSDHPFHAVTFVINEESA